MKTCLEVATEAGVSPIRESSGWHRVSCPRHDDANPSLRISDDETYWKCMVCALTDPCAKGDAIAIHRWFHHSTFEDALASVGGEGDEGDPVMHYLSNGGHAEDTELETAVLLAHVLRYGLLGGEEVDRALGEENVLTALKKGLDKRGRGC